MQSDRSAADAEVGDSIDAAAIASNIGTRKRVGFMRGP